MSKLYVSINKNSNGDLCDRIFTCQTKTAAKNQLRDQGLIPKLVLTWNDVTKIINNEFKHQDLTEEYRQYVLFYADDWETAMTEEKICEKS